VRRTYPSLYDHKLDLAIVGLLDPVGWGGREETILEQATRLTLMVSLMGSALPEVSLFVVGDLWRPVHSAACRRLPRVDPGRSSQHANGTEGVVSRNRVPLLSS
jgi:hypothetical protein